MKYTDLVYIGRFQLFHNGHLAVIKRALEVSERVIILVGSANSSRNPRNPFKAVERFIMLGTALEEAFGKVTVKERIRIDSINDFPYNDQAWISNVQSVADYNILGDRVGIIGFSKDATSEYLKWFPSWEIEIVPVQFGTLNSSNIRAAYFDPYPRLPDVIHCPKAIITYLTNFVMTPEFAWITAYRAQDLADLKEYGPGPAMCADALVTQKGHILLVTRKKHPGKGQLALPGGHLDPKEVLRSCAIRELREESNLSDNRGTLPPGIVDSFINDKFTKTYDHPERSTGPRKITQLFRFELPDNKEMYRVAGMDDAEKADWYPLGSLKATDFFADHASIVMDQLGIVMKD